jgi:hypothetical protein
MWIQYMETLHLGTKDVGSERESNGKRLSGRVSQSVKSVLTFQQ